MEERMAFPSLWFKTIMLLLLALPFQVLAADQHHFYRSSGIAKIGNQSSTFDETWVTQIGFNYALSSAIKLDIGYSESPSFQDFSLFSQPQLLNQPKLTYKGIFGGAKVQHTLFDNTSIYAKGGVAINKFDESLSNASSAPEADSSEISPYFSIGASIPATNLINLDLNVEISYQDPELKSNVNPIFLLGAQYRF
ncbi:outer membrane protein [Vibrio quintilis]|nr:outer membrane beta-barrel protein [Vibrio quintilis]